jgi:uncharacterized protein YcfL
MNHVLRLGVALGTAVLLVLSGCASVPRLVAEKVEIQGNVSPVKVTELLLSAQQDLIRINAVVVNEGKDPVVFQYRVRWVNVDGFQIWDDEPWKPQLIQPGERLTLTAIAPTTKARDFRLVIRK